MLEGNKKKYEYIGGEKLGVVGSLVDPYDDMYLVPADPLIRNILRIVFASK